MLRLLLHPDHAVRPVELDHAVERGERRVGEPVHGKRAPALLEPEVDVVGERELEEVVGGDHEQTVVAEPALLDREADVAERTETVVVRGGAVVPDDHPPLRPPPLERLRVDGVRDDVDAVDRARLLDRVEDPVDHRPPADRQQRLGGLLGERPQAHRVAGGEQERLHAATTAPASDSTYGGRWTPCSVTIAVISPAGVTSNAGFRAGKRAVTSAGSRSSIGISAPLPIA